jgi:ribonuclease BN (tRNA processing enzyme)
MKKAPDCVLNTHIHVDHSGELSYICNKHKLKGKSDYKVYTPSSTVHFLEGLVMAIAHVGDPDKFGWSIEAILANQKISFVPIDAGSTFKIKDYEVEVLEAYHTIQTVGYGISSFANKLKPEYCDTTGKCKLSGQELGKLRKSGIEISEIIQNYDIVFFCDSTIQNLTEHTEWRKYPIVVCECTGLDGGVLTERGHTGLSELLPVMLANKDKKWVIIHISKSMEVEQSCMIEEDIRSHGIDILIVK